MKKNAGLYADGLKRTLLVRTLFGFKILAKLSFTLKLKMKV